MRAHSRPEPLVRLEVSLNLCVVQQGGAITWRKPSSKNTDQQEREEDQLPRTDPENSHSASASQTSGNIWTVGRKMPSDSSYTVFHPVRQSGKKKRFCYTVDDSCSDL